MMFTARLLDLRTTAVVEKEIVADSLPQATELAHAACSPEQRVLSLQKKTRAFQWEWRRSAALNYPLFCRELRVLLGAGMGVVEAIDTLCEFDVQGRSQRLQTQKTLAVQLRQHLQQGLSLSRALSLVDDVPVVLLACVRSVEHTSDLSAALDDYLRYHDMFSQLRSKLISASLYPAIVVTLGLAVSVFLLLVVMPQFADMYGQLRGQAKGLTRGVIALSQWLSEQRAWLGWAMMVLLLWFGWWISSGRAQQTLGAWVWQNRWLRPQMLNHQLALFYQTLHLLYKGGYALVPALGIAQTTVMAAQLKQRVQDCQADIEQGKSVSQSFYKAGLASEIDRRLLAAAEHNGELHSVSSAIAQIHRQQFETFIERLTRLIEPVLLLLVALFVGSLVVIMYMPVFEMGVMSR